MNINVSLLQKVENNDPSITKIEIINRGLDASDIKQLVIAIQRNNNSHIKALLLYENEIDDEGRQYLSQLTQVEYIALDINDITNEGAKALAKIPSLVKLDIASNNIGDEGFAALIKYSKLR